MPQQSESPLPDPAPPEPASPEHVPPDASGFQLSTLETKNLSLLYIDPIQTYLTPYLGRSFENALAFHKKVFRWEPWERSTVLLKDFSDYGNAAALASPSNMVLLDVAPLSLSMETFSPGERFFTLTNHELAHVAAIDVWNSKDASWRRFLGGKPMPIQKHPESILYNFLTSPRNLTPRWYMEGSAVFFETWMAGGLGRGQGAYDEMVFRAKVRDEGRFFSPLGLESEGTQTDFQVGANSYLYGTRFFSYLALTYGVDQTVEWLRRSEDSKAFYASQFKHVFGRALRRRLGRLDRLRAQVPAGQPRGACQISADRGEASQPARTRVHVARLHRRADQQPDRRRPLSGKDRVPRPHGPRHRQDDASHRSRRDDAVQGDERRLRPFDADRLLHQPELRLPRTQRDRRRHGQKRRLLTDARIGDLAFNPADKSLWGIRHQNGFVTLVRVPAPYTSFNQVKTFRYGEMLFDLDISPDGELIAASYGTVAGKHSVRVWRRADLEQGNADDPVATLSLAPSIPENFTFTPDGKALLGNSYYTGVSNVFRFDIASGKYDVLTNAATGFFRPQLRPDGSLVRLRIYG